MRLYSWVNMYLEGIHAGIQTAHVMGEISAKYRQLATDFDAAASSRKKLMMYQEWEDNHKVIQIYNGGYSSNLRDRLDRLCEFAEIFDLPFGAFCESDDALDGALTAIGVIVPEDLYKKPIELAAWVAFGGFEKRPETKEGLFYEFLHSCKHAR